MRSGTAGKWLVAAVVVAAVGWAVVRMSGVGVEDEPMLASRESSPVIPRARAAQGISTSPISAAEQSNSTAEVRSMLEWQRGLYDSQTAAPTFAAAVEAAEGGNLIALRELHDFVAICKPIFEYVRTGGDRAAYVENPFYDRCAQIASAQAFIRWPLDDERLTAIYWQQLGKQFDDPVIRSYASAEDVDQYTRAAGPNRRDLHARIEDNIRHVLRSGDVAAWFRWRSLQVVRSVRLFRLCRVHHTHDASVVCQGTQPGDTPSLLDLGLVLHR